MEKIYENWELETLSQRIPYKRLYSQEEGGNIV